ncbi:MAG TPA: RidA family protein [Gaiellaceae bacterium]|nr:RidA family protein [Gaiellaceae bacterium]
MERRRISSGSPYEPIVGFSRAVVAGKHVFVGGTAPVMPDGQELPDDPYAQARRCLEIIVAALEEAGARPDDVVRTRIYLTSTDAFDGVARAHAEVFGDVRPASTAVVTKLLDDRWHVEIEAEAMLA